jgi:hypothetical protein
MKVVLWNFADKYLKVLNKLSEQIFYKIVGCETQVI